ncbi:UDP-N-acetylglucosamine diphosphorylase [Lentibacillus sp. JNUCC-1]|uniref:bifunctional UDP-N-acetylglucosamine diphosphorylase/glucosamine-1-phosphate N-acetyltransferase GlmU n=1 Tax=Lentibacillus sp. JNUCC-1 TaxID=2654513 RepID=UPI0012E8DE61|nr:bifunctional UDP-N-acetylglucosamine diphosphorylase/glucosamine-1-phosphate N-acetyltransferase GlmU [Lentibacillus sp. JNUCC-1]MUV38021.1 UDP-N-acetylglucosamine diphosphorylase [Lentibacillus sp. JNUCC-1]
MTQRYAVILAAGQGTRMKSKLYKVLHPVMGKPMVQHVIDQLTPAKLDSIITVVGFGAESVSEQIGNQSAYVVQKEQLGTAHAVQQAEDILKDKQGTTLVVCGDTPLITHDTYQALIEFHERNEAKATVLTTNVSEPTGYGRIVRDADGHVERIVEHKDASNEERLLTEINTGTYCFDNAALWKAIQDVSNDNAQGEYYLPDVVEILKDKGEKIGAYMTPDPDETLGVNDRAALAEAEKVMKKRLNHMHMKNGVAIIDPDHTYIEPDVVIEADAVIQPGTIIRGKSVIHADAQIGPHTEIIDCEIDEGAVVTHSVAKNSRIGKRVQIGPYAHIRPEADIANDAKIGNFVEVKKATIGEKSKVSHLSYIGDAHVGSQVNIGCGTITVNYDGKNKFLTTIEDDAFIGCNSNLIAPVTIGKGSYVAAGSTINKHVPEDSLAIAREKQTNKEGYAAKIKNRQKD